MATSAERLRRGARPQREDTLLARYMGALLRTRRLSEQHADIRTCAHCGARARFDRVGEGGTWAACSACGEQA